MKNLVSLVRATHPFSGVARTQNPLMGEGVMIKSPKAQGEEVLGERASPLSQEPLFSLKLEALQQEQGLLNPTSQTNAGSLGRWGI